MKLFPVFLLLLIPLLALAQPQKDQKRDLIWPIGYDSEAQAIDNRWGNMVLDFRQDTPVAYFRYMPVNLAQTNAAMCDTAGNLLFYTNGIMLCDSVDGIMYGSDTLNPGQEAADWNISGYRTTQSALALPQPGNDTTYYLFHTRCKFDPAHVEWPGRDLFYTKVNVVGGFGFLMVTEMRVPIVTDTLDWGRLTACRHANGRDWWVLAPYYHSDKYHRLLLDSVGLHDMGVQYIGPAHIPLTGQSHFTPDGSKYVSYGAYFVNGPQEVLVYDFDRCSGLLYNYRRWVTQDTGGAIGCALSPNSRYLYASLTTKVFQFDLWANDVGASKTVVAVWDGFYDTIQVLSTTFYLAQLAPDGKIYISTNNGTRYYHVIENPDEPGLACNLRQHGFRLPCFNFATIPNYPNFRLGALDGSPCDTLGIDSFPVSTGPSPLPESLDLEKGALDIYPNPASDLANVGFGAPLPKGGVLSAFDMNGRLVWERHLSVVSVGCTLNVGDWASGTYFLVMRGGAGEKASGILIKN